MGRAGPRRRRSRRRLIDFDDDGFDDLLLPAQDEARLYRNNGDGSFSQVSVWAHGGSFGAFAFTVDLTGDQRPELLYVIGQASAEALSNGDGARDVLVLAVDPEGKLTELSTLLPPRAGDPEAQVLTFGDFDQDGGHDIYHCYMKGQQFDETGTQFAALPAPDVFLQRAGPLFHEVTEQAGFTTLSPSQAAMTVDLDQDGHLDLIVGSDQGKVPDQVFLGDGAGGFDDQASALGITALTSAMGYDAADVDGDLDLELYVTDETHLGHTYYRQEPTGTFTYATTEAGFGDTANHVGWGVGFHDVDLDGDVDLFVANGRACTGCTAEAQENQLFQNDGQGQFTLVEPPEATGLYVVANSRAALFSDIDRDGDLDILVTNVRGQPTLLRNEQSSGHWLQLRLRDPLYTPAVGATVTLKAGDRTLRRWVKGTPGYGGSSTQWVHFGLGEALEATEVQVKWPDGTTQPLGTLAANQHLTVTKTTAPHRDPATLAAPPVPGCAALCAALAACNALADAGAANEADCVAGCATEDVGDYFSACVVNTPCAALEACLQQEGDRQPR